LHYVWEEKIYNFETLVFWRKPTYVSQQSNFLMLLLYFIFSLLFWNNNASSKIKMLQNAKQNVIEIISSYRSSFSFKYASFQLPVLKNERQKMNVSDPTKQLCLQHFLLCFHLISLLESFFIVHCCFNSLMHNSEYGVSIWQFRQFYLNAYLIF